MSGSRARTSNSVSLFPFLAVLVCAMGALIFLLIVTTTRIRSEAVAQAKAARVAKRQTTEETISPPLTKPRLYPEIDPQIVGIETPSITEPAPPKEPERIEPIPGLVVLGPAQSNPVLPPKIIPPSPPPPPEPEPIWPAAIAQKPAPPDPNGPLRSQVEKLKVARQSWLAMVTKREQTTAKLKQQVEELTAKLKKINSQIEGVAQKRLEDRKTERDLKVTQSQILGQLAKVEQKIEDTNNRVDGSPTKFQVVPFDGQTGTNYRPIIIECTKAGMRFQPEGVLLTQADFDGFTVGKNPLLAGAKALSDYWMKASLQSGGKEPEPYVLLIVRPSGSKFYAARQLLEPLDRPFGYELIEENLPLDIPPIDPVAAELCRNAVESTLKEREDLKRLLAAHGAEMLSRNPKYRVIRKPGGGFDVEYAPQSPGGRIDFRNENGPPADGFPQTDRYGQPYRNAPGYRSGTNRFPNSNGPGSGIGERTPPQTGSPNGIGRPSSAVPRNPFENPPGTGNRNTVPGQANGGFPNRFPNAPGRFPDQRSDGGGNNFSNPSNDGNFGARTNPNEPGRLPDDIIRRSQGNVPYRPEETGSNPTGNNSAKPGNRDSENATPGPGGSPTEAIDSRANSGRSSQPNQEGTIADPLANNSNTGTPNGSLSPDRRVNPGQSKNPSLTNSGNQNGTSNTQNQPGQTNSGTNPQNANSTKPPGEGTPNTGSPNMGATGGGGPSGTPTISHEPAMPNFMRLNSTPSLNRAESYQRRWGLSDPRASIGFEREITVRVEADRLVVGNAFAVSYNERTTPKQLGAGMLEAIERTARKWGRPPISFYWIPTVQFELAREQVPVYQQLNQTAKSWGLETTAKAIGN